SAAFGAVEGAPAFGCVLAAVAGAGAGKEGVSGVSVLMGGSNGILEPAAHRPAPVAFPIRFQSQRSARPAQCAGVSRGRQPAPSSIQACLAEGAPAPRN